MQRDRLNQIRSLCRDEDAFEALKALIPSLQDSHGPGDAAPTSPYPSHQAALLRVVARIRETLDLPTLFEATATEVRHLLDASRVGVFRFDPDSRWTTGEFVSEDVVAGYSSALDAPVQDHCFSENFAARYHQGRVQAVENIYSARLSPCHIQILERFQVRANLVVPLRRKDVLWGLLCVHQCDRPRHWQSWEIDLVQQIAAQLDVALVQAEFLQQLQDHGERQKALFRVITSIHHCLDLNTVFRIAVREMRSLLGADRVGIFRFHPDSDWDRGEFIAESVAVGYPSAREIVVEDRCFGGTFAEHYQRGQIQAVPDIYDAGLKECHIDVLAQFGIRANLVVPLLQEGYLWGLLCVHQCDRPRRWQRQDIELAQHVATHLDVALRQADLVNRSRQQSQELVAALNDLKEAQSQLVQSEKMSSLGQLVAGVAHEINNPVNFIYGNLTYLDDYTRHMLTLIRHYQHHCPDQFSRATAQLGEGVDLDFLIEDLPKTMTSVQIGAERIRDIVLSLQRFARSDSSCLNAVDLHDGLDNTLMILQHRLRANLNGPEIKLVKQYGDLPPVDCHAGQINQVFMNVLVNAVEALEEQYQRRTPAAVEPVAVDSSGKPTQPWPDAHRPDTAAGQIQIVTACDDEAVTIRIIDNGPGLASDVKSRLFDPFFTTKAVGKGTGLGLSISHQIITDHHGSLDYISRPGQGTECRITLPVRQPQHQRSAPPGRA